jgi:hypothetical protein
MLDKSLAPRSRRPLPEGRLSLMRFAGYGVEKKRLSRTVDAGNPNEIVGLWRSGPPKSLQT